MCVPCTSQILMEKSASPAKSSYNLSAERDTEGGLCLGWLGTVCGATALTLAAVLGLAAVVTGFAATGSLAFVFALTGVFVLVGLVEAGRRCDLTQVGGTNRSAAASGMQRHCRSAEQAAYGRA